MSKYRLWLQIEEIDEDNDNYENVGEPRGAGTFVSYEDADRVIDKLADIGKVFANARAAENLVEGDHLWDYGDFPQDDKSADTAAIVDAFDDNQGPV
jgi:hypothetical protein